MSSKVKKLSAIDDQWPASISLKAEDRLLKALPSNISYSRLSDDDREEAER